MFDRIKRLFKKEKTKTPKEPDFDDLEKPDIEIEEEDDSEQMTLPPTPPNENEQSQP